MCPMEQKIKRKKKPRAGSRQFFLEAQPFLFSELANWPKNCQKVHWLALKSSVTRKKRRKPKLSSFCVIQLGLEPRTPSLKGMCSTC